MRAKQSMKSEYKYIARTHTHTHPTIFPLVFLVKDGKKKTLKSVFNSNNNNKLREVISMLIALFRSQQSQLQ